MLIENPLYPTNTFESRPSFHALWSTSCAHLRIVSLMWPSFKISSCWPWWAMKVNTSFSLATLLTTQCPNILILTDWWSTYFEMSLYTISYAFVNSSNSLINNESCNDFGKYGTMYSGTSSSRLPSVKEYSYDPRIVLKALYLPLNFHGKQGNLN